MGKNHDDAVAGADPARPPPRRDDRRSGRATDEDALLARDPSCHAERISVGDPHVPIDRRRVERPRPEVLADTFGEVGVDVAGEDGALGVGADDQDVRVLLLEVSGDAGDRATGADAGDERRDPPVGLPPDLRPGRRLVRRRVVFVEVLVRLERAGDLLGEAVRDSVVGLGRFRRDGRRRDYDLGAVRAQERDLLLAHLVRHHEDALVAADRRRDGETMARVAGRRLDDRAARLQLVGPLGNLDHPKADPVLHAPAGVQHLELRQDGRAKAAGDLVQADERRLAHGIQERVENLQCTLPSARNSQALARCAIPPGGRRRLSSHEPGATNGSRKTTTLTDSSGSPVERGNQGRESNDVSDEAAVAGGGSVLVVDDDPFIGRLLEIELKASGYDVRVASDGARALEMARENCPELVLADVMMPNMDGFELTRQLRRDSRTTSVSVIMLTTRGLSEDKLQGFAAGADDYIVKPFDTPELLARIRGVLRRAKEMRQQSPLTGLPGNVRIEEEIELRVQKGAEFAILYADLDHFKAFNDHYGFLRGDQAIQVTARLIQATASERGGPHTFVGHIGGDDFVGF